MEQNLLSQYSTVRYHRPKGLDRKRILLVVLLLAVCMWLLYLVKNSHHNKTCIGNPQNLSERNLTAALGRKGRVEHVIGAKAESQDKNGLQVLGKRDNREVGDNKFNVKIDEDIENLSKHEGEETRLLDGEDEASDSAKFIEKQFSIISEVNIANQASETETVDNGGENVHRVEAFLDENGIPPGASYFIKSTPHEPREVKLKNLDTSLNESRNPIDNAS